MCHSSFFFFFTFQATACYSFPYTLPCPSTSLESPLPRVMYHHHWGQKSPPSGTLRGGGSDLDAGRMRPQSAACPPCCVPVSRTQLLWGDVSRMLNYFLSAAVLYACTKRALFCGVKPLMVQQTIRRGKVVSPPRACKTVPCS